MTNLFNQKPAANDWRQRNLTASPITVHVTDGEVDVWGPWGGDEGDGAVLVEGITVLVDVRITQLSEGGGSDA